MTSQSHPETVDWAESSPKGFVKSAASHALVFLPVALSLWGGGGWSPNESAAGWLESDLRYRRVGVLPPGALDYDSSDDDESVRAVRVG